MKEEYPFAWFFKRDKGTIRPRLKNPRLELIKQDIPIIQNLDASFWENPLFIRWQLMRLNKMYQEDVDTLWEALWSWFNDKVVEPFEDCNSSEEEVEIPEKDYEFSLDGCFRAVKDHQALRECEAIHKNFYPDPQFYFSIWDEFGRSNEYVEDIWHKREGGYFIENPNSLQMRNGVRHN